MAYDNRPNLSCKQFDQQGCDYLYLAGHNCVCGTGGTISSNSGYQISGYTIFNASGGGSIPSAIRIGHNANNQGESSIAVGFGAQACCMCSVVIGCNNISRSCGGNIIGGYGNMICTGNTNSTLLGVNNCTINANCYTNSVIVPNLVILTSPTGSGGYLCYNITTKKVEQTTGAGSTASGENVTKLINQASHGFTVGNVVGFSGSTYNKPLANGLYNGEVLGIVSKCYNTSCFDLTQAGYVTGLTGLVTNTTYFLSPTTAGLLTATEPSEATQVSKAVLIATSSSSAWVLPYPGYVISTGATPGGGGITGATNLGSGNGTIYTSVVDNKIQLKTLSGGTNVTLTCNSNYIGINAIPAGGNGEIQYNNSGAFASSSLFCWNSTTGELKNEGAGGVAPSLFLRNAGGSNAYVKLTSTSPPTVCLYASHVDSKVHLGSNGCVIIPSMPSGTTTSAVYYNTGTGQLTRGAVSAGGSGIGWSCAVNCSTVAGCGTVAYSSTICANTYYGVSAGTSITTGSGNVGVGVCSLYKNLTGNYNTGVGYLSLFCNTSSQNTALGAYALFCNQSGYDNTGIGQGALRTTLGGYQNTALGSFSLTNNTSGYNNVAMGYQTLGGNTTGHDNIASGYRALFCNTTTNYNIAIGPSSLYFNTGGTSNIAIGYQSLYTNCCGKCNIAIGCEALHNVTTASDNIAIGRAALRTITTSVWSIAIGNCALFSQTTGNVNVAIGQGAMCANTTGQCGVAVGYLAMQKNVSGNNNIGIGVQALQSNIIGYDNVVVGYQGLVVDTGSTRNIAIGSRVLANSMNSCANIGIGYWALSQNINGGSNIAIGECALLGNTGGTKNIAIGCNTLRCNKSGGDNLAIGSEALYCNFTGTQNIAIGRLTMNNNFTGSGNIGMGNASLYQNTVGSANVGIGESTLEYNRTGYGNTALGSGAGRLAFSGGSYNVLLGLNAGYNETGSSKLHIANCPNCTLICGDFSVCSVKICGRLETSGAITPASGADAGFPNNSIYYSTTQSKLVYKDSGGTVNPLY